MFLWDHYTLVASGRLFQCSASPPNFKESDVMTENQAIHPGKLWLDTNGKPIQAHGGSIFFEDGTFYWYGENKERTLPGAGIWHWGVRCYASRDLYNWEDLGNIIQPRPDDVQSTLHPSRHLDRPHIIYNRFTQKYVCWVKIMGEGFFEQTITVLTADSLRGPYTVVTEHMLSLIHIWHARNRKSWVWP